MPRKSEHPLKVYAPGQRKANRTCVIKGRLSDGSHIEKRLDTIDPKQARAIADAYYLASMPTRRGETLGDDVLVGTAEIARFLFGSTMLERQVADHAMDRLLPAFHVGAVICARKSALREWISRQELAALQAAAERRTPPLAADLALRACTTARATTGVTAPAGPRRRGRPSRNYDLVQTVVARRQLEQELEEMAEGHPS